MTWRAFIIGLLGVVGLCLLTPVSDYAFGNTSLTGNHFPVGAFAFLVILTLGVNLLLKLVRRRSMLHQPELMLVYCMMLVASTVPASGLMRHWLPVAVAAPYLSQRPDLFWEGDVLKVAPEGILLTKDMKSTAARKFFEGTPEGEPVRVPWDRWARYFTVWGVHIWLFYLATFCICGILRKQWVESDRLMFAVARVPLEFTAGSTAGRLLPTAMCTTPFVVGVLLTFVFGLARLSPLLVGAAEGWRVRMPLWEALHEFDWSYVTTSDGRVFPLAIGFAFLVPSDVSFSVWFFYLFVYGQAIVAYGLGRPLAGGRSGAFTLWQQAGAFITLAVGLFWMARRHLWTVVRKAFGRARDIDDSGEPIGFRLGSWGLLLSLAGLIGWNLWFGVGFWAALALVALTFSLVVVHSRVVAQGGLFFTQQFWNPPMVLHGLSGGRIFSGPAAVVAQLQGRILTFDAREILGPHVMNSLRISSVFERRRRLLVPALLVALLVAMPTAGYASMEWVHHRHGTLNLPYVRGNLNHWTRLFDQTHLMISRPGQSAAPSYGGLTSGVGLMALLVFMRSRFYWWPVHPLGFAMGVSWCTRELWFSFFLGWLAKILVLKLGGGKTLRGARLFFLGVIITESAMVGATTFVSLLTGTPTGKVFLSH